MSAVIFATDPTGNNNPFLKIITETSVWFAAAGRNMNQLVQDVSIFQSEDPTDPTSWIETNISQYINFITFPFAPFKFFAFKNGYGIITGNLSQGGQVHWRALAFAGPGASWQLVAQASPPQSIGTPTFDVGANQWTIPIVGGTPVVVNVPWPAGKYLDSQDGDNVGNIPAAPADVYIQVNNPDANTDVLNTYKRSDNAYQVTTLTVTGDGMSSWNTLFQDFHAVV